MYPVLVKDPVQIKSVWCSGLSCIISVFFVQDILNTVRGDLALIYKDKRSDHYPNHIIQETVAFYNKSHKTFIILYAKILNCPCAVLFYVGSSAERCEIVSSDKALRTPVKKLNIKLVRIMQRKVGGKRVFGRSVQHKINIFFARAGKTRVKIIIGFFTGVNGDIIRQERIDPPYDVIAGDRVFRFEVEAELVSMNALVRP